MTSMVNRDGLEACKRILGLHLQDIEWDIIIIRPALLTFLILRIDWLIVLIIVMNNAEVGGIPGTINNGNNGRSRVSQESP